MAEPLTPTFFDADPDDTEALLRAFEAPLERLARALGVRPGRLLDE